MGLLEAQDSQFRLQEDGSVCFQAQESNPLPGVAIAKLVKGGSILKPGFSLLDGDLAKSVDEAELSERLRAWFASHVKTVLEPLAALEAHDGDEAEPVKAISAAVYEAMGILPREELESHIAQLDAEMRTALRAKKIRLGPILVFIPALNKPAAVRLRAMLWGLYHERDLPMDVPKDGIVSFEIDPAAVDKGFYQSVGYPVFGRRAIRIDMLDRVISAVYDGADKGVFRAQHQMAEWLGSSIDGLYDVLEAMGHKRIEEAAKEEVEKGVDQADEERSDDVKPGVKPELSLFRLKKGKAFQKSGGAAKSNAKSKGKPSYKKDGAKSSRDKKSKPQDRGPRVIRAEVKKKAEDSPFAVLEQLKKSSND